MLLLLHKRDSNSGSNMNVYAPQIEANQSAMYCPTHEVDLYEEDLYISWSELILKEKIGTRSFGSVIRADWRGSDVAVKILKDQSLDAKQYIEFSKEVSLMKRLRHPNIVLWASEGKEPGVVLCNKGIWWNLKGRHCLIDSVQLKTWHLQ